MPKQLILMLDTKSFPRNICGNEKFCWFFLGRDYDHLLGLKKKAPLTFNYIDLGDSINDIAYKIRRPYLDYIAILSARFASLPWWISVVAGKNVMGSPVFLYICYLKLIRNMLSNEFKDKNVCIVSESAVLLETIRRSDWIADYRVKIIYNYHSRIIKDILRAFINTFKFVLKSVQRKIAAIVARKDDKKPIDKISSKLTVLRTWVGESNFGSDGNFKDFYFPDLINYLRGKGEIVAILPIICNIKRPYVDALRWFRRSPMAFIIPEDYYTLSDYVQTIFISFQSYFLMFKRFVFDDLDVTLFFQNENLKYILAGESGQLLMHYFLMKRLGDKKVKAEKIIMTFENMSPEKPLILGVAKYLSNTKIFGFQHCSLFPLLLCLYTSNNELDVLPMPDKIVCSGKFFREILIKEGFPSPKMIIGPALRFQYLLKLSSDGQDQRGKDIVLVTLPLAKSNALELLSKAWNVLGNRKGLKIWLKPHPMMPELELQYILNKIKMPRDFYTVIEGAMAEVLPKVALLIATASATIFDAIACGIPVIRVRSDINLDLDPMDWFPKDETYFVARTLTEINHEVDRALNLKDDQYARLRERGKQLIRECFSPVNDQTMAAFIN